MRRHLSATGLLASVAILTACGSTFNSSLLPSGGESSSSEEILDLAAPEELTYQGTVETLPVSSVPEATHRLSLGEGLYLFLRSDTVDLNEYLDQEVRVKGVVRATVEGDADLMRVSYAETILAEASSSSLENGTSSSSDVSSAEDASSVPAPSASSASRSSVRPEAASSASPIAVGGDTSSVGSRSSATASTEQEIEMTKASADASLWTQKYCSTHIGFCIPV
ncbi:MAG: hypothetical protein AAB728_03990, partial [Patescibacteria group bacterium]